MKTLLPLLTVIAFVFPALASPRGEDPVNFDRAVAYWVQGAIGAKILPDGRIKLADCYDPGLWAARLGPTGPNFAYAFEGPGYKLNGALGRAGVPERFVALARAGAFGPGPDLTAAWQAWILTDGIDTLRQQSGYLAEAMTRAGLHLGPDLTYSPDLSVSAAKCDTGRCDCDPCTGGTCGCETQSGSGPTVDCAPPRKACETTIYGNVGTFIGSSPRSGPH
jgi:hypothetical protein